MVFYSLRLFRFSLLMSMCDTFWCRNPGTNQRTFNNSFVPLLFSFCVGLILTSLVTVYVLYFDSPYFDSRIHESGTFIFLRSFVFPFVWLYVIFWWVCVWHLKKRETVSHSSKTLRCSGKNGSLTASNDTIEAPIYQPVPLIDFFSNWSVFQFQLERRGAKTGFTKISKQIQKCIR